MTRAVWQERSLTGLKGSYGREAEREHCYRISPHGAKLLSCLQIWKNSRACSRGWRISDDAGVIRILQSTRRRTTRPLRANHPQGQRKVTITMLMLSSPCSSAVGHHGYWKQTEHSIRWGSEMGVETKKGRVGGRARERTPYQGRVRKTTCRIWTGPVTVRCLASKLDMKGTRSYPCTCLSGARPFPCEIHSIWGVDVTFRRSLNREHQIKFGE